ncbi:MAG: serine hydrolase [Chroococcidiopsidaceae cyanobacterium CP_BM_ER_R8_30]|nr:serine hydrolase [Chroococcidiopsidaceae cyanobacterium CP_BM_ER_R8_30]
MTQPSQPLPIAALPHSQQDPTDVKELEAFIDQFFARYEAEEIPGKVFILVKDGSIFFSKGYGYANAEQRIPVIPNKTLFRVGSLSKLFTATAVMQLAEQGKLQLNDDVNRYLKQFQIENNGFKPLTSTHLLTHTDGFDVAWTIGGATHCQSPLPSLEQFLSQNLPQRVRPPGELYVYGDAGMALAGYLVEALSGVPFTEYINQNILQPLDMGHSSFLQPLPPELETDLAVGYEDRNGTHQRTPFTCGKSVPSVALSATATDMAHFMIAHLQGGHYGKTRILNETTVQDMHRQHFTNFPTIAQTAGSAYGFYERFQNHQRVIEHGGSLYGYNSQLFLMPEQNLGFFVAYNKEDKVELRENLIEQFLDHYYPEPKNKDSLLEPHLNSELQQQAQKFEGNYRFIRYPQHSFAKLWVVLFGPRPDLHLKSNSDGTLTLLPVGTRWVQVKPSILRYRGGKSYLRFRQDNQGRITNMSLSNYVFVTYEKLLWYETIAFQQGLLGFCLIMFLSACSIWPINPLIQYWRSQSFQASRLTKSSCDSPRQSGDSSSLTRLMRFLLGAIGILNLSFLCGMLLVTLQTDYWEFFFGMPPIVTALLYLPILSTGLTAGLPVVAWLAWRDKHWSVMQRLYHLLIMLAAGIFILLLDYWSLLGFQL